MTGPEISQKWVERVAYDLDTARAMLQTKRYVYVVFMCQQSIEKCLKALLAYKEEDVVPIHNLRRLAELARVVGELEETTLVRLDFLSRYYINARYKEDLKQLLRGITETVAGDFIQFSEGVITWLYQKMK